jgi:hypothetical protein
VQCTRIQWGEQLTMMFSFSSIITIFCLYICAFRVCIYGFVEFVYGGFSSLSCVSQFQVLMA